MSDDTTTPTAPRDYAAQLQSALPQPLLPLLGEWAADELYLHGPRPSLRPDDWLFRTSDLKFLPSRRPCAVLYHKHPPRVPDNLSPAAFLAASSALNPSSSSNPSSALNPSSASNPSSALNPSPTDADSDTRFARDEGPIHLPHPFRPVLQPTTVLSASASVASASVASLSRAQSMMNPSATHNPDHEQDPVPEDEEPDDLPSAFDNDQDLDAAGESQAEEQKDGKQGARGQQGGKSGSKSTGKQKDKASKKAAKQELENRPKMRSLFSRIDYTPQRIIDSRGNPTLSAPPGAQETDAANETLAITNEQAEYVCSLMPRMSLRHIQQSAAQASTFKNEKWSVSGTLLLITLSGLILITLSPKFTGLVNKVYIYLSTK